MDGQGTRRRRKIAENFNRLSSVHQRHSARRRRIIAENFNRLSSVHQRHRQTTDRQTDGRAIAYSELEREFTFAKNPADSRQGYDAGRDVSLSARL